MNINPKISVIIPVYNIESYISKCIDSIISQTYTNLEIVLVNDGSTDGSLSILKEYAQKDDRICIINKENGGLSSARNAGIDVAAGDYISFIDGDDWVSIYLYEYVLKCLNEYGLVDLITFSYYNYYNEEDKPISSFNIQGCYSGQKFYEESKFFATAWSKIYKTSFLKKHNFCFIKGIFHEDIPFTTIYTLKSNSVVNIDIPLYYYRRNRIGSILETKDKKKLNDWAFVISFLIEKAKDEKYELKKLNNTILFMCLSLAKNPQFKFNEILYYFKRFHLIKEFKLIIKKTSFKNTIIGMMGKFIPIQLLLIYYMRSKYLNTNWHIIKKIN